jgi:ribosomal protein S18 acetylase RimI-like enzyme
MIRDYQPSDFDNCVNLVNKVWEFDKHFSPVELAKLFQRIYTGGSLAESNFRKVVEEKDQLKGFLFGKIENQMIPKSEFSGFLGQLKIILKLLSVKGAPFKRKWGYLKKINSHEINRRKVESRRCSEINLFVVDPESQGRGWGKKLINEFMAACQNLDIKRIVLETDRESNFGFYEHLGFKTKGSFYSPLLQEYSGESGETYVFELYI